MEKILEVNNLHKKYGELTAVNNISFYVRKGELYAFLGQNGAGKSTTIRMIITLLEKDGGKVLLNGKTDENYIRNHIGVVFQDNVLDGALTVKENLLNRGALYLSSKKEVLARYEILAEKLNLIEIENQRFKTLSGGQKRRVEIARALFSNPELLILDEPTTGLDPETRQVIWRVINDLRKHDGITVFLTTHYMEEAANADHIVVIHKGNIVVHGSPSELKDKYSKDYFRVVPKDKVLLINYLDKQKRVYELIADQYYIEIKDTQDTLDLITDIKENIKTFEVVKGTLDDVFVNVVGEQNV
ncbi:ABC transporter ATP-binding protein [Acholeplasma laidlawii]|jgi:multidrug/hemolysin transport system ATP-binding protein|uniref:ABC-type transport system, ATPase component n=2 Tax=Acholeplasma laidlawii TaxID=2148 RepID=A9NHS0_ACHLI|nr:ABC transporter ATP-binding protein [Acholeplasma laidlawii]ABX81900.1 ABC-type transport system, ATPase component [Acholeplasma laidlawii PG-8A]NWH10882.1 ABC transporter ATP-binding protein [Acholeplasma laidlawii]NWH12268.1 ABC transporter ATP-binding protein [Acholeplasma laidlawii]NWH13654.1 ABC transporter ATP-binding protein [Acholeplasma laidlawii]NWH15023.1 ABC transporter ATP-binding protein [Acholeplasma laidlawii]